MTHTPGPWTREEWAARGHYTIRDLRPSKDTVPRPIATIEPSKRDIARASSVAELPLDTLEANARLIAAAPELLEALRLTVGDWRGHVWWCLGPEYNGECRGSPTCAVIRAAIAKAEGR